MYSQTGLPMGELAVGDDAADVSQSNELSRQETHIAIGCLVCRMCHQDVVHLKIDGRGVERNGILQVLVANSQGGSIGTNLFEDCSSFGPLKMVHDIGQSAPVMGERNWNQGSVGKRTFDCWSTAVARP